MTTLHSNNPVPSNGSVATVIRGRKSISMTLSGVGAVRAVVQIMAHEDGAAPGPIGNQIVVSGTTTVTATQTFDADAGKVYLQLIDITPACTFSATLADLGPIQDTNPGSPSNPFASTAERDAWAAANLGTLLPGRSTAWAMPGPVEYRFVGPGAGDWENAAALLSQSIGSDGDLVYTHPTGQKLFNGNFLYSWTRQGGGDFSNLTVESTSETTVIDETVQGRNGIVPVLAAGYLLAKGPLWVRVRGGYGVVGADPVLTVRVYLGSTVVGIKRIDLSTFTRTTENMGMSLLFWIEPLDQLSPGTNLRLRAHHYGQVSKGLADSAGSFLLSEDETYSNIDGTVAQNLKVTAQWSALGSQTWAFFDGIEVYR